MAAENVLLALSESVDPDTRARSLARALSSDRVHFYCEVEHTYFGDKFVCDVDNRPEAEFSLRSVDVTVYPASVTFEDDLKAATIDADLFFSVPVDVFNKAKIDCRPHPKDESRSVCTVELDRSEFKYLTDEGVCNDIKSKIYGAQESFKLVDMDVKSCRVEDGKVVLTVDVDDKQGGARDDLASAMGCFYAEHSGDWELEKKVEDELPDYLEKDLRGKGYKVEVSATIPSIGGSVEYDYDSYDVYLDYHLPLKVYVDGDASDVVGAVKSIFNDY